MRKEASSCHQLMMEAQFSPRFFGDKCPKDTAPEGLKVPKASIDASKNSVTLGGPGSFKGRARQMKDCNPCRILAASPQNMMFGFRNLQECFGEPREEKFDESVVTLTLKTAQPGFKVAKSGFITHVDEDILKQHTCTSTTYDQAKALAAAATMLKSDCDRLVN